MSTAPATATAMTPVADNGNGLSRREKRWALWGVFAAFVFLAVGVVGTALLVIDDRNATTTAVVERDALAARIADNADDIDRVVANIFARLDALETALLSLHEEVDSARDVACLSLITAAADLGPQQVQSVFRACDFPATD